MEEILDDLKELDNLHNPDEVPNLFGNVPDGTYQVRLDEIYVDRSKSSGRMQTIMKFVAISGDYKDVSIKKYCGMETRQNLDFLTSDLKILGIKSFKWSNLVEHFNEILDNFYEILVVTKREFQNVYIQRKIEIKSEKKEENVYKRTLSSFEKQRDPASQMDADIPDIPF